MFPNYSSTLQLSLANDSFTDHFRFSVDFRLKLSMQIRLQLIDKKPGRERKKFYQLKLLIN